MHSSRKTNPPTSIEFFVNKLQVQAGASASRGAPAEALPSGKSVVRLMSSRSTRRTKPWGPSAKCWPAACSVAALPGSSLMSYASSGRDTEGPNSSSARACACPSNRRPDRAARTAPAASRNCPGSRRQDNTTRCKPDSTTRCSPWLSSSPAGSSCSLCGVAAGRLRRQLSAARHALQKRTFPSSLRSSQQSCAPRGGR